MARKVYRVTPSGSRWELKHSGGVLYSHDNKAPVVSQGQATAKGTSRASSSCIRPTARSSSSTPTATTRIPLLADHLRSAVDGGVRTKNNATLAGTGKEGVDGKAFQGASRRSR